MKKAKDGYTTIPMQDAILGACMLDNAAYDEIASFVTDNTFTTKAHRAVHKAIRLLHAMSEPIDLLTVMDKLKELDLLETVGGPAFLAELTNRVASSANIVYHARILKQEEIRREADRISHKLSDMSKDRDVDVFDMMSKAEEMLFALSSHTSTAVVKDMTQLAADKMKRAEELSKSDQKTIGIPTGFYDLDKMINGLVAPDLIILAARPGMGKTGLSLSLSRRVAKQGFPVAFFSLEMSSEQLFDRIVAQEADINSRKITDTRKLEEHEWQQYHSALEKMSTLPIYFNDKGGINVFELRSICRKLIRNQGVKLIVIDYLQLMTGPDDGSRRNREQVVSEISRSLKAMAKELEVPVLAMSQLSRAVETRGGAKRPQLSDLRESGSVEQDADVVAFIYRPEYYNIYEDAEGESTRGLAELIIAKNRHGETDRIIMTFKKETTNFGDRDPDFDFSAENADQYSGESVPEIVDDEDLPF